MAEARTKTEKMAADETAAQVSAQMADEQTKAATLDEDKDEVFVEQRVNIYGDIDFDMIIHAAEMEKEEDFERMVDVAILEARFCKEMRAEQKRRKPNAGF